MESNEELAIIERLTLENREATKYDFDSMDLSSDTESMEMKIDQSLLDDLDSYTLPQYYEEHINRKTGLFKTSTIEEVMRFSDSISRPLTILPSSLSDRALELFRILQYYMRDRSSSDPPIMFVMKFLRLTMDGPSEIVDEAYLQVIKQTNNNPNPTNNIRGWNMFAIMASCYPPSVELFKPLLYYLRDITRNESDAQIVAKANYIAIRMVKTFEDRRKLIPCEKEISYIEANKPIFVDINFFSGGATSVAIESYTKIGDLKTSIMKKLRLNITKIPYYAMYEICKKKDTIEERYLDETSKVADILALWAKEQKEFKKKHPKDDETIEFKFYIKIQFYYGIDPKKIHSLEDMSSLDIDTITMNFVQMCHDVATGKFLLDENTVRELASKQLFVNYGTKTTEEIGQLLEENIKNYVPYEMLANESIDWKKEIMDEFLNLTYKTKKEAKLAYLYEIKDNPLFQSYQFNVKYSKHNSAKSNSMNEYNPDNLPEDCIVAVRPHDVLITDENRNPLVIMPLETIASWAVNSETIVIVQRLSKTEFSKYYFDCYQSKLFQILMDGYSNLAFNKTLNQEVILKSVNLVFSSMLSSKLKEGETKRSREASIYKIKG